MDATNTTDAFAERIRSMTEQLREELTRSDKVENQTAGESLEELYRQGAELGLTDTEIVRQLIGPIAELLRPGLSH